MDKPILRTRRLELRPTHPDMFEGFWAAIEASLPELGPWMAWAVDPNQADVREFMHKADDAWATGAGRPFTIFMNGETCGQCSLDRVDALASSSEIGYWLRSDLCGRGLVSEAGSAVVDNGFRTGLHRIELHAGIENVASIRIAEKIGFQREGLLRGRGFGTNGHYDMYVYGLLASDERTNLSS